MGISFPDIDRYIFRLYGNIGVTWYSLSYVVGIIFGWRYSLYLIKKTKSKIKPSAFDDYITYLIIAIIVGGRMGYVLLYSPAKYLASPIEILKTYDGGMSFHGALVGVIISVLYFAYKHKINPLELSDILVQSAPIGFMLGRIANFINGELYGHVTFLPWGVVFPHGGEFPRHPSQIYEAFSEGLILFCILFYYSFVRKLYKKRGALSGIFLVGYSIARSICEIFRIPDFTYLNLTSGQFYSAPMFILGIYLIYANKSNHTKRY